MTATPIIREFEHNGTLLQDVSPTLSPEQVMQHYSNLYPELTNATLVNKGIQQNGNLKYEFQSVIGKKG